MKNLASKVIITGAAVGTAVGTAQVIPQVRNQEVLIEHNAMELYGVTDVNITPSVANTNVNVSGTVTNVNSETKVITNGDTVTYSIPYNVVSKNGKSFNIPNITATANPSLVYSGTNSSENQSIAKGMESQITYSATPQTAQSSTSSGVLQISFKIPQTAVGMKFNPNITLHCGTENIPVNLPNINTTANYGVGISVYPKINGDKIDISGGAQYLQNWKAKYNPYGKPMTSLTFSMGQSDTLGSAKYTAISNPDLIVNSNGSYTLKGALLQEVMSGKDVPLFNIAPNGNDGTISSISAFTDSATWDGIDSNHPNVTVWNHTNYTNYNHAPADQSQSGNGSTVQMSQSNSSAWGNFENTEGTEGDQVTFGSTIKPGIKGSWQGTTFNYVQGGQIAITRDAAPASSSNLNYVHLNQAGINIMDNGTPAEKYALLSDIYNANQPGNGTPENFQYGIIYPSSAINNVAGIGTAGVNSPLTIETGSPSLGIQSYPIESCQMAFTNPYTISNSSTTTNSNSVTAVPSGIDGTIVSKTFTLGQNTNNDGNSDNFSGLASTDYLAPNASGFMLGASNEYTPTYTDGNSTFFHSGNGQSISFRTGLTSYNTSSVKGGAWGGAYPAINGETNQSQPSTWVDSKQNISLSIQRDSELGGGTLDPNSTIVVNLGAMATVAGPITVDGNTIPSKDYTLKTVTVNGVEQTEVQIKSSAVNDINGQPAFTRNLQVSVPTQYAPSTGNMSAITVSGYLQGSKSNPTGNQYQVNGAMMSGSSVMGDVSLQRGSATIHLTPAISNDCLHSVSPVTASNTATLTDMVHNSSTVAKQYIVVGQFPTDGATPSLPGNFGQPSAGRLSSEAESFNNPNCPVYVLPASALNNTDPEGYTNQQIMEGTNPFQMKGAKSWIENSASGWVKYTPGMSLKGMVGYTYMPTINPGQNWTGSYNVQMTNIKNGTYQYDTSQFKYFDTTDGVGSASNIVTIAPNGENIANKWDSNVVLQTSPGQTVALTAKQLAQKVTFNSVNGTQTESLGYLISNGADNDGQYDLTPATATDHLQQSVDLATDAAALKKAGYELVGVKVTEGSNSVYYPNDSSTNFFQNVGIINNTKHTHVLFIIKQLTPTYTDNVSVTVNGKTVQPGQPGYVAPQTGKTVDAGQDNGLTTPVVPAGYKIDGVKVVTTNASGEATVTEEPNTYKVPSKQTADDVHYIYNLVPVATPVTNTVKVEVKNPDGTITPITESNAKNYEGGSNLAPQSSTGIDNADTALKTPVAPKGYHIIKVTNETGKETAVTENNNYTVPAKFGKADDNTVYTIAPDSASLNVTVNVEGSKTPLEPTTTTIDNKDGYNGETIGTKGEPNATVQNDIKSGKYTVKSVTLNGTTIPLTSYEKDLANGTLKPGVNRVVYNLAPAKATLNVTVNEVDSTGKTVKVLEQPTTTIADGTAGEVIKTNAEPSKEVEGDITSGKYKVVSVTFNGKTIPVATYENDLANGTLIPGANHVVYNVTPITGNVTTQVIVQGNPKDPNNKPQTVVEKDAQVGSNININGFKVPAGYHLVGTSVQANDGKVNQLGSDLTTDNKDVNNTAVVKGTTHIVYTIAKNSTDSVNITYVTGNGKTEKIVVPTAEVNNAVPADSKQTVSIKVPNGYELAPNTKTNPTVTSSVTTEGKTTGNSPLDINDEKGSKSVTVTTPSSDSQSSAVNITVHLDKVVKNTVKVEVENPNGTTTEITAANLSNYKGGSNLTEQDSVPGIDGNPNVTKEGKALVAPVVPNGYHLVKVTNTEVDPITNKIVSTETEANNYAQPKTLGTEDNNTVYTIAPDSASLNVTVNVEGIKTPLEPTTTTIDNKDGYNGETIGTKAEPNETVQSDIKSGKYKVVSVTLNGTTIPLTSYEKDLANGTLKSGVNKVVYNLAPNVGTVSVKVVTADGTVVVENTPVQKGNVGTALVNYGEPKLPKAYEGYHIIKTTVQTPMDKKPLETTQSGLASDKIVEGNTQVVYTIAKDATSTTTVKYQTPNGDIVPGTKVTTTTVPGGSKESVTVNVPKGYKLVPKSPVTVNGTAITAGKDGNVPVNTGTPEKGTTNHVVITVEPIVHDSVSTTVNGKTVKEGQPGYVAPQTGAANVSGNPSGIHDIKVPSGYHINGITVTTTTPDGKVTTTTVPADKIASYNVPTTLGNDNVHVTYNLVPSKATLTTTVVNDATGKVIETMPVQNGVDGNAYNKANYIPSGVNGDTYTQTVNGVTNHYKIVKITNEDNNGAIVPTTVKELGNDKLSGNDKVVYHVVPAYHDSVIVNVMQPDGTYKETTVNLPGSQNTAPQNGAYNVPKSDSDIKTPKVPAGYKIDSITVETTVNGKTTTETIPAKDLTSYKVPTKLGNGDVKVIYNISQQGSVTVQVKNLDGTAGVVAEHTVDTDNVGAEIKGTGVTIPNGYHLVNATLGGATIKNAEGTPATTVSEVTKALSTDKIKAGVQHVVYTIAKNTTSTTTVKYQTPNGDIVPGTKVTTTTVPGGSKESVTVNVPKGYKLVPKSPVTVNGTAVTVGKDGNVPVNTGTPEKGTTNHVVITVEPIVHDSVTTTVNGKTVKEGQPGYVAPQTGAANVSGNPSGIHDIKVPSGYHINGITVTTTTPDGKVTTTTVPADKIASYNVPTTLGNDNVHVIYNLVPNPVKKYTTKITVTTPNGVEVPGIPAKTVETPAGDTVTGTGITVPKGYKIVKVTVDGKDTTPTTKDGETNVPAITHTEANHTVHYVIEKIPATGSLTVQVKNLDGTEGVVAEHTVETANVGSPLTGTSVTIPNGYHLVNATLGGVTIKNAEGTPATTVSEVTKALSTDKIKAGVQHVIYTIAKNTTSTTTVKYQTPNGDIVPGTKVTTTTVPGGSKESVTVNVPKGYKLVPKNSVTVNGTAVTAGKDGNVPVNTGTPEKGTTNHVVITVEPIVHDSVSTTVNGKTVKEGQPGYVAPQTGAANVSGNPSGIHDIKVPSGYHINGITVTTTTPDGKVTTTTVPADKIASYKVPTTLGNDNVHVTYNLVPNPVKKYTTKITVTTPNGTEVPGIPAKTVETPAGDTVTGTGITVPKGYKIVKVTVDGKDTTPTTKDGETNVPAITHTEANHTVHYVIEKIPAKPVVKNGDVTVEVNTTKGVVLTPAHEVENGEVGTKINSDKTGVVVPAGYQISSATVNGKPVKVTATTETVNGKKEIVVNVPTGSYTDGTTKIVYTVSKVKNTKPVIKTGKVTDTVETENGTIVVPTTTTEGNVGDAITGSAVKYTNVPGYHIVGLTVNGKKIAANANGSYEVPAMTYNNGTQKVVWIVAKNPVVKPPVEKGSVTVKVVNDTTGATVVGQHTVDTGNVGTTATGTAYTPTGNAKIKYVTVNGKTVPLSSIPHLAITDGTTNIVYHLVNPAPVNPPKPVVKTGNVTVKVVNDTTGTTVVGQHTVDTGNVGTTATGTAYTPTGNSKIKYVTVNGQTVPLSSIPHLTITDGTTNIVYHLVNPAPVVQKGKVTDTVETTNGTIVVPTTTAEGNVGDNISAGDTVYTNVPGYHVVGLTVNGQSVQPNANGTYSVPSMTYNNGTQHVVWIVAKNQAPKPEANKGSVTVEIKTTSGEILVPETTVASGDAGTKIDNGIGYNPIKGYHLVGTTVNGSSEGTVSISQVTLTNGVTKIVYTVAPNEVPNTNPTPAPTPTPTPKTGKVTVTVNNENGQNIVPEHVVDNGNVGTEVTGDGYTPTAGNKIIKITVNGVPVSSTAGLKIADGTTHIVYTIGSDTPATNPTPAPTPTPAPKTGKVTVTVNNENGQNVVPEHVVDNGNVGTTVTGDGYTPTAGNKIIKITVNGVTVNSLSGLKIADGTTHIVYTIGKDTTVPQVKPQTKPETKPEQKPETKPQTKPETKPEQSPEAKPQTKPVNSPEGNTQTIPVMNPGTTESNSDKGTGVGSSNVIPVITSNNQSSAKIQTLPDTGLNTNSNKTEKAAAAVGILGVLGLGFLLRKKK